MFYGWGKKRQALKILSKEGNYKKTNGLISIDAISEKVYVKMTAAAKSEDVSEYLFQLCKKLKENGSNSVTIFLDNNSTHKDKMRYNLWTELKMDEDTIDFKVRYVNIAPYSPDYNLAEYGIHLLRLKVLHHCSAKSTLDEKAVMIQDYLKNNQLFPEGGIKNTINHILNLNRNSNQKENKSNKIDTLKLCSN